MAVPPEGSQQLHFETQYARGSWAQYLTLLWKNNRVYWRSPGACAQTYPLLVLYL